MQLLVVPVYDHYGSTQNFQKIQHEATVFRNSVATAYRKAEQGVANTTLTKIELDTVINDPGSHISTVKHCYVVSTKGYYSINGSVTWAGGYLKETFIIVAVNTVEKLRG